MMRRFLPALSFAVAALLAAASPVSADPINGGGGSGGGQSAGQGSGDPTYNWSLSGNDTGSGTLTTDLVLYDGVTYNVIIGFTGTIDGYSVSLDCPVAGCGIVGGYGTSPDGSFYYNNILYPNGQASSCDGGGKGGYLDYCGLLLNYRGSEANIYEDTGGKFGYAFLFCGGGGSCYQGNYTGDSFQIPEPASLALLGTGLVAMAGAIRRRRRSQKA